MRVWARRTGPTIRSDSGAVIGEGAYANFVEHYDFGLIRLKPGVKASAQMCHFGGPIGLEEGFTAPAVLEHYGQATTISAVAPGRTAVAVEGGDAYTIHAFGAGWFGDSGSGVMHSGRAVGVLEALDLVPVTGEMRIMRLLPQLEVAQDALRIHLKLQTAPRL